MNGKATESGYPWIFGLGRVHEWLAVGRKSFPRTFGGLNRRLRMCHLEVLPISF